jgi:hypothetical protein
MVPYGSVSSLFTMTTNSECPFGETPAAVTHCTDGSSAENRFSGDTASALCGAIPLIEGRIAKAILEAAEQRRRAAVMLIQFAPRCGCNGAAPCWDIGLSDLMARCGKFPGEWGPLRLDETTLVIVVQGFVDSAYIQRRASAILQSLTEGWCVADQDAKLDCAIGIGLFPEDGDCASMLLQRADEALRDLRAVGQNAAGFNLRRTLPAERPEPNRSAPRLWHRAAVRAGRDQASALASDCIAQAEFNLAPAR